MRAAAILISLTLCVVTPREATACAATDALAALHKGYVSLVAGSVTDQNAAVAFDPIQTVRRLSDEGATADIAKLAQIAADVTHLHEMSMAGPSASLTTARANIRHLDNLNTVHGWIKATGCPVDLAIPPAIAVALDERSNPPASPPERSPQPITPLTAVTYGALAFIGVAGLVYASLQIWNRVKLAGDLRHDKRVPVSIEVTFLIAGEIEAHKARVVDLSRTGLKIKTEAMLPVRTQITLSRDDLVLPASVMWSNAYFAGLRLSQPLDDETIARLRGA